MEIQIKKGNLSKIPQNHHIVYHILYDYSRPKYSLMDSLLSLSSIFARAII